MPRATLTLPTAPLTLALGLALVPAAVTAQSARVPMTAADIEAAVFSGTGDLPSGQSALTARVQILLDRAGVSPGVVDGFRGGMSDSALRAFERKSGLPVDGRLDPAVWALLQPLGEMPVTADYTITDEDAQGLVDSIPADYAEKAAMTSMGYTSVTEKLAEKFHMDEKFLAQLNPGAAFQPGAAIKVVVPAKPIKTKVTRIIVDKESGRVAAYDAGGRLVVDYPATVGSAATPSPHGTHTVTAVAKNPDYTYNPNVNFKQGDNDKVLRVPPGPNGPVGNMWIDLSQPTYGIHGTPTPSRLFVNQSNGCVRLTNWDATELGGMVVPNQTVVEFLAPGLRIADVTPAVQPAVTAPGADGLAGAVDGPAAPLSLAAGKPAPRPLRLGGVAAGDAVVPVTAAAPAGALSAAGVAADPAAPMSTTPMPQAAGGADATLPAVADALNQALTTASGGALQPRTAIPAMPLTPAAPVATQALPPADAAASGPGR